MATLADNNVNLIIDGVTVNTFFRQCTAPDRTSESIDVTAGAGVDHMMRAPGLLDTKFEISIMYDTTSIQTYIQHIKAGQVVTLEWGPEGSATGKPRHVQDVLIVSSTMTTVDVEKSAVMFEISCEGAAAPTVDLWSGGVYS